MSLTLSSQIASKYKTDVFIETGSCHGDAIQLALDVGFKTIYSVDCLDEYYQECCARFKGNPNVHLFHCTNSPEALASILPNITCQCTFWLDAHFTNIYSPLLEELAVIATHHIKNHIIMMDDRRCWLNEWHIAEDDVIAAVKKINPAYTLNYEDNKVAKADILVAFSP